MAGPTTLWTDEQGFRNPFAFPRNAVIYPTRPLAMVVQGNGFFPVDMIRYDCGRVRTPLPDPNEFQVKPFRVLIELFRPPTEARWESFGWKVVNPKVNLSAYVRDDLNARASRVGSVGLPCPQCYATDSLVALSRIKGHALCLSCWDMESLLTYYPLAYNTMRHAIWHGEYIYNGSDFP